MFLSQKSCFIFRFCRTFSYCMNCWFPLINFFFLRFSFFYFQIFCLSISLIYRKYFPSHCYKYSVKLKTTFKKLENECKEETSTFQFNLLDNTENLMNDIEYTWWTIKSKICGTWVRKSFKRGLKLQNTHYSNISIYRYWQSDQKTYRNIAPKFGRYKPKKKYFHTDSQLWIANCSIHNYFSNVQKYNF